MNILQAFKKIKSEPDTMIKNINWLKDVYIHRKDEILFLNKFCCFRGYYDLEIIISEDQFSLNEIESEWEIYKGKKYHLLSEKEW